MKKNEARELSKPVILIYVYEYVLKGPIEKVPIMLNIQQGTLLLYTIIDRLQFDFKQWQKICFDNAKPVNNFLLLCLLIGSF